MKKRNKKGKEIAMNERYDEGFSRKSFDIKELAGETISEIFKNSELITFRCKSGKVFKMFHEQDCCENVYIEDITGELMDLIGKPILSAYSASNGDPEAEESATFTFYHINTIDSSITIRWYGESNGYYGESADFYEIIKEGK